MKAEYAYGWAWYGHHDWPSFSYWMVPLSWTDDDHREWLKP